MEGNRNPGSLIISLMSVGSFSYLKIPLTVEEQESLAWQKEAG